MSLKDVYNSVTKGSENGGAVDPRKQYGTVMGQLRPGNSNHAPIQSTGGPVATSQAVARANGSSSVPYVAHNTQAAANSTQDYSDAYNAANTGRWDEAKHDVGLGAQGKMGPGDGVTGVPVAGGQSQVAFGRPTDYSALAAQMASARTADVGQGLAFGSKYFGQGNADIASIEDAQKQRAFSGLTPEERSAYTQQATTGINQQLGTGLRALRSTQASNGVRGNAAAGAAIPILNQSNTARANADANLNIADLNARQKALSEYQGTVTGERQGLLGTGFGFAGLGATDRANAMKYGLGQDYLNAAKANPAIKLPAAPVQTGWGGGDGSGFLGN